MTHDPLCPIEPNPLARECRTCDLIAKVRADEQGKRHSVWTSTIPQPQERRVIR